MFNRTQKTKDPENRDKAYDYAVFLLSLKLRTVGEIVGKMQQRGYSESVIESTVEQLKSQRYVNDRQYAEIFLENLKAYRTFGYYGIKKKLMSKKLPGKLIEEVMGGGLSLDDETEIGKRLLKKEGYQSVSKQADDDSPRYESYAGTDENKFRQKMANRLKSRGFRSEVVLRLLF